MSRQSRSRTPRGRLDETLARLERNEVLIALRDSGSQRALAARSLKISRSRLYRRMEALGIDPDALHLERIDTKGRSADDFGGGESQRGSGLDTVLARLERREIMAALRETGGQRTLAARRLGISRSRLYRRLDALGISPEDIP